MILELDGAVATASCGRDWAARKGRAVLKEQMRKVPRLWVDVSVRRCTAKEV